MPQHPVTRVSVTLQLDAHRDRTCVGGFAIERPGKPCGDWSWRVTDRVLDRVTDTLVTGLNRFASVNRSGPPRRMSLTTLAQSWHRFEATHEGVSRSLGRDFFRLIGDVLQSVTAQGIRALWRLPGNLVDRAIDTRLTGLSRPIRRHDTHNRHRPS